MPKPYVVGMQSDATFSHFQASLHILDYIYCAVHNTQLVFSPITDHESQPNDTLDFQTQC